VNANIEIDTWLLQPKQDRYFAKVCTPH